MGEEKERGEGCAYPECIVLISIFQLCVSEILKFVGSLVQSVLQSFYLIRNSMDACVSDHIPIH